MTGTIPLRVRLRDPAPLIGTMVTLDSPETIEVLAEAGFDWLFLDMEHSPLLDTAAVQRLVQAVAGRAYTLVRAPDKSATWIKRSAASVRSSRSMGSAPCSSGPTTSRAAWGCSGRSSTRPSPPSVDR